MEIIQNSDMWDVIPDGTDIRLGVQADKINVFNADGSESLIVRRDRS
jgi:iron(III) transport system ATP-binding protein